MKVESSAMTSQVEPLAGLEAGIGAGGSSDSTQPAAPGIRDIAGASTSTKKGQWCKLEGPALRAVQIFVAFSVLCFLALYVVLPTVFYFSPKIRRLAIFRHTNHDERIYYKDTPESHGMNCTKSVYYNMSDGNRIGVWEMALPEHNCKMYKGQKPLLFFLHGNTGSRSTIARKEKYNFFRKLGMEVVTLDYRGFGDSQGEPSADKAVEDVYRVFQTIRKHMKSSQIIVWGHSLGTGIATKFVAELNETVGALVLETPFDRVGNVMLYHSDTKPLRILPWFKTVFVDTINNDPETAFNSIDFAKKINVRLPIIILACEDDATVPAHLAKSLFDGIVAHRKSSENTFIKVFPAELGFGHMYVHRSKELPGIVEQLWEICCKAF